MTRAATIRRVSLCAALALAWMPQGALAQQQSVPNALQGFSQNKDQPVKIEAASLEVRDKDKVATLSGNVLITQGQNVLRGERLVVDVATGAARVEAGSGRVSGVFVPSSADDKKDKDKDKAKDSGRDKEAAKPKEAPKAKEPAKATQEETTTPAPRPAAR